jgi:hypothetical protein
MAIQGFDSVVINALNEIQGQGTAALTVTAGDATTHALTLAAGQISATNSSNLSIAATGYDITIQSNSGTAFSSTGTLGAQLTITGNSIKDYGVINIPTGSINLNGTNGVTLSSDAQIIDTGVAKVINGQTAYASAGSVALTSSNGNVELDNGSLIDVSANAVGGNAGAINLGAATGLVTVAGNLQGNASSTGSGGSFTLDANTLGTTGNPLTSLNDTLTAGGFNLLRSVRDRNDSNLTIAADTGGIVRATASTYNLGADKGNIDVIGTINASGSNGGSILLAAGNGNNVTLESSSLLDAHATGTATGGSVTLETALVGSTVGSINMMNSNPTVGNQINVAGSGGTGGTVLLRAPQINGNDVAVNYQSPGVRMAGTGFSVSSGANVTVEAYQRVSAPSNGVLLSASSYQGAINTFMTNATANSNLMTNLMGATASTNAHPNISLVPGLEIDSSGDLTLGSLLSATTGVANQTNAWDLSGWRFNDGNGHSSVPVILTLRAAGNLNIDSSLSDGFQSATSYTLLTGLSASYRLVAGAELTAANTMAVGNTGNLVLAAGSETTSTTGVNRNITSAKMNQIRTGTGFIDIAAGGDVTLGNKDSVIYTAGVDATSIPNSLISTNSYIKSSGANNISTTYFPVDGGNINIFANGNINGAQANQLVSEWQWRQGDAAANAGGYGYVAPAWWINFSAFRQNIGALGGGNVTVQAGKDISNLSVVVPTSGYVDSSGNTVVLGGGNLTVTAGGNINSGIFYVGNGQGNITAGGSLGATATPQGTTVVYPDTILLLGQGGMNVQSVGDLNIQDVLNPTMLGASFSQKPSNVQLSYFYTYSGNGNISLTSIGGNVQLANTMSGFVKSTTGSIFFANTPEATTVYPESLFVTALSGAFDNSIANPLLLFPSTVGNLQILAATNVSLGAGIGMSDMSPNSLLAVNSAGAIAHVPSVDVTTHGTVIDPVTQLITTVHANDTVPVSIVAGGNITANPDSNTTLINLPKSAVISAGQNITDFSAEIQNQSITDTTSITAGRDITYSAGTVAGLTVSGPGQVVLQAGRNIDLASTGGVLTTGNLANPYLPTQGANITVLAGVGQGSIDTGKFINTYINPASATASANGADLISFVNQYNGSNDSTVSQAFADFNSMSLSLQDKFVNQVFFNEIKQAGRNGISSGNYSAGYATIATLFDTGNYAGDLSIFNSQIKTERGGDINILTPGGGVDAGLANANSGKPASQIGVVTVDGGNINAFVNNDFTVNQSRVFTIQGGDILMWSSNGNIDAGKGSKTASSTPPPLLTVDPKTGAFAIDATSSIVGSGIGVLLGNKNVVPGSVDLYAPAGVINAGDAGITSAGNIYLGATQVIGANNISFGGTSAGVPSTVQAPVSVSMGSQDASKAAEQSTQSINNLTDLANAKDFKPTFLSVDVFVLGDGANP